MADPKAALAFLLGNGPWPVPASADEDGIRIAMTGPTVIGGPEPPQIPLDQLQAQLTPSYPTDALRKATGIRAETDPLTLIRLHPDPESRYGSPDILAHAPGQVPFAELQRAPWFDRAMGAVQRATGTDPRDWPLVRATGLVENRPLPPWTALTGEATPPEGSLGSVVKQGLSKAAARAEAKFARLLEEVAPEMQPVLATLRKSWPQTAQAIAEHDVNPTLLQRNRALGAALDRVAQSVHDITLAKDGASVQPFTGEAIIPGDPSGGFMAGRFANQSQRTVTVPIADFTPRSVKNFIEQNADALAKDPKNLYVGAWPNRKNGLVYLDVAQKYKTPRAAIIAAGKQAQPEGLVRSAEGVWPPAQDAIYDVANKKDINVGNLYEFLNSPQFQQRLDEMFKIGSGVMKGKDWWDLHGSDLERVYGKEHVERLAGFLASTSPASAPVHNLRVASEYMRRFLKGEPIIQPDFRIPETAVGSLEGSMGATKPGDFNAPGTMMPMESMRIPNLTKVVEGKMALPREEGLLQDKVRDMFHALLGENVGVYDRRYAKLVEDWDKGIYAEADKDKLLGSMDTGKVSSYALVENALRTASKRTGVPLSKYTATVWEGIGDEIKRTGQLYGMEHQAHSIPEASLGFPGIFQDMLEEKAQHLGISVAEMEKRLRSGDAELLGLILSTPIGWGAYRRSLQRPQAPAAGTPPASRPPA